MILITCTGGRPEAFALLERWICEQDFKGRFSWVVVDDCEPRTPLTCKQFSIHAPVWTPGAGHTMNRNLNLALNFVQNLTHHDDKILIIEDDECYLPGYLRTMDSLLDQSQLAGLIPARYYNVAARRYRELPNHSHASLCQTGFRREMITRVRGLCSRPDPFIDVHLWQGSGLIAPHPLVVSIKGMPGRTGIGIGHHPRGYLKYAADPELKVLADWAGPERAAVYAPFAVE